MTHSYSEMSDELNILKAQMQILTKHLIKDEVISDAMLRTTIHARVSNIAPGRGMCYASIFVAGIFIPAVFIASHFLNGFMNLPFLIATLIMCAYGVIRSCRALRLDIAANIHTAPLTEIAHKVAIWRKTNSQDALITAVILFVWCTWFVIGNWADLSADIDRLVFVFLIFTFVIARNIYSYVRVSRTSREILNQIDELKK